MAILKGLIRVKGKGGETGDLWICSNVKKINAAGRNLTLSALDLVQYRAVSVSQYGFIFL